LAAKKAKREPSSFASQQSVCKCGSPVLHADVIGALRRAKTFTPGQKDKLINAIKPMFVGDETDKIYACRLTAATKDPRALPYIRQLSEDSDQRVRRNALYALKAYGP
jgi:hypothetical protein